METSPFSFPSAHTDLGRGLEEDEMAACGIDCPKGKTATIHDVKIIKYVIAVAMICLALCNVLAAPNPAEKSFSQEFIDELGRGKFEDAIARIAGVPNQNSFETWAMKLALADAYYAYGKFPEAKGIYDGFFKQYEKDIPETLCELFNNSAYKYAQMLINLKEYESALKLYELLLRQKNLPEHIERQCLAEMAEITITIAGKCTDQARQSALCKEVEGYAEKLMEKQDLWFGKAIILKAHILMLDHKADAAKNLLDYSMPALIAMHQALVEQEKETGEPLTRVSPMAECRYLLAVMLQDEADRIMAEPDFSVDNAAMREEVLSLLLGVKENGKRKGDGAYNHFINVYLQYPESNWAADAGRRAEVVRAILVDAFGGKVESKVTPEMTTRIRQIQFRDARALFAQGKIDKARERLKEVLNSFPDCPEAISALGDLARCYMLDTSNTNAQLQAQTIIGELAKRFHGNDECLQSAGDELIRLAENWLECGRPDNRIQTYELFFRLYPTHSSCPIYLASFGEKAYQAKDYATALHYFQTTANNYTNSPRAFDALNRIVTIYEETNDRTNAIAAASNYVKRLEMPGKVTQELMTARFRLANAYKDFGIDILRSGTTDAAATAHGKEAIAMAASAFHELAETLKEPPSTSEVNDEERKRNQYLRKAALFCEAFCLDQASGGTEKEKAVALYVNLAEQGDIGAQFHLGSCYINGTGVEKDEAKAFAWYRKAAEQGDARAQCILGAFYEFGTGVEHDYAKAVEWYRKAAKQGDSQGIEALQRIASGK